MALQLRKKYWDPEEPKLFFYKRGGVDLDLYIPQENLAVQASYDLGTQGTRDREVNALVGFSKAFKLDRALIITYDAEETIEKDGLTIEVIPAWKWLLM